MRVYSSYYYVMRNPTIFSNFEIADIPNVLFLFGYLEANQFHLCLKCAGRERDTPECLDLTTHLPWVGIPLCSRARKIETAMLKRLLSHYRPHSYLDWNPVETFPCLTESQAQILGKLPWYWGSYSSEQSSICLVVWFSFRIPMSWMNACFLSQTSRYT